MSPENILTIYTFATVENVDFFSINQTVKNIIAALDHYCYDHKEELDMSDDDEDYEEEDDENMAIDESEIQISDSKPGHLEKVPKIITIFNQINPKIFIRSSLNLDLIGSLISTLLNLHNNINHILILQKLAQNNKILTKFINDCITSKLESKTAVQLRKYIRTNNDFTTWFVLLLYRLDFVKDELWLSKDEETCEIMKIFVPLMPHLKVLLREGHFLMILCIPRTTRVICTRELW